eukprot:5084092-Pyramimonas_sp.AAC.1
MRRTESHREAGALEAVICNAIWTEDRCRAEGYECDGVCARCATGQKETMAHRVWSCPHTCGQDHPWIRQSATLCDEAARDITKGTNLELWLRGLLPSTWNS